MAIQFWEKGEKGRIRPELFSTEAEDFAKTLAKDSGQSNNKQASSNKQTQLRRFFDEVVRLNELASDKDAEWGVILPQVHMLVAKAAYANGRKKLVSDSFLDFIREAVGQVEEKRDLHVFTSFFEAVMGFYRLHGPRN